MADWFEMGGGTPSLQKVIAVAHIVDTTVAAPEFQGGLSAWGSGTSSTQIGVAASAGGANAIVIGDGASAPGSAGIAIGVNAAAGDDSADTDTIAIGHNVSLTGNAIDAIAIGSDITAAGMLRGIVIGDSVTITNQATDSVNIGQGINVAYNSTGVLIGKGITSTQVLSTCVGIGYAVTFTSATIAGAVAIGAGAIIDGGNSHIAIGSAAQCYGGLSNIAIGTSAKAGRSGVTVSSTVAIGQLAVYGSYNAATGYGVAVGDNCIIYGDYNVGVGRGVNIAKNALNTGSSAAFGGGQANQCTVIGAGSIINQASHRGTIVGYTSKIGVQDTSKAQDGIILGSNCQIAANHDNAVLIGNDLTSSSAEDFCAGESSALYRFLGTFPDNNTLLFGTGKDASIKYDGTNLIIDPKVVGSGYISTNGANIVCNALSFGGDTPTGIAYIEGQSITSSSYVGLIYGQLEHSGASGVMGAFQTTMTNNSSHASPLNFGSSFQAWTKQTAPTLAYNYGGYFQTGFYSNSIVQTAGANVFYGGYFDVLGASQIGGAHAGGAVYAAGAVIAAIGTPAGTTFTKWGLLSLESVELVPDKKLALDATVTANGNSYFIYDSASSSLDAYVDATKLFDCTSSLLTLWPSATFVTSIDASTGKIGLAGTSATGTSLINASFSGSLRGCLSFVYEATGGTIAANINNDITVSADIGTGYAGLNAMTVNYDGAGTNNFYAQKADFGMKSTLVLTQGTQNIYGLYCHHSKGTGNASSSGGTVNLYGIYVGAMSAMSGSITTAKWAAMFDDDVQINTNDKLILGGSTGTKEDNEIYWDGTDIVVTHAGSTKAKVKSGGLSIEGTNELVSGSRCYIQFGDGTAASADRYLKGAHNGVVMTSTKGITMPRAGSITAVSYNLECTIASAASTADIEVRINGSNVFSITGISTASTGVRSGQSTQARGTDTFAAGDILGAYYNSSTAVATVDDIFVLIEVTFDS